jgi:hypothetical protein
MVFTIQMLVAAARTTSIASILLLTAIVAGCAAIAGQNFLLGFLATTVSVLAVGRTSLFVLYSKAAGKRPSMLRKFEDFVYNLILMSVFLGVAIGCFVLICLLVTVSTHNVMLGGLLAFSLSLAVFVWLLWLVPTYRQEPFKNLR